MNPRVLVLSPFPERVIQRARNEFGAVVSQDRVLPFADAAAILEKTPSIEALMFTGNYFMTAEAIGAWPSRIKILANASVGNDRIDLAAAAKRGFIVTNAPEVLTNATADLAILLMLGACRRMREYAEIMNNGWGRGYQFDEMLGVDFSEKTLGIFGFGRIGQATAKRARAFGVKILYHNRRRVAPELEQGAVYYESFHDMLPHCQILSLHAPGGEATANVLDAKAISLLPRGAIVVNTARGSLIDEEALLAALKSRHVAAAGLDVFRNEPHYDVRFRDLNNVFMIPHMGSATVETRDAMGNRALDNIAAVLSGKPPLHPVIA